jgi:hypothetical protein
VEHIKNKCSWPLLPGASPRIAPESASEQDDEDDDQQDQAA